MNMRSHSKVFYKIGTFKTYTKFTGNTFAGVPLIKKNAIPEQWIHTSYEFSEVYKNTFCTEYLRATGSI